MVTPQERERKPNQLHFSESAMRVMADAKVEALRHNFYIANGDHLLLALMRNEVINSTLLEIGIDPNKVRIATDGLIHIGIARDIPIEKVGFTRLAKDLIQLSVEQAEFYGQKKVMPFDLLAAYVLDDLGVGVPILKSHGLNKDNLPQVRDTYMILNGLNELKVLLLNPGIPPTTRKSLMETIKGVAELAQNPRLQYNL